MSDGKKILDAKQVYTTLCKAIESREWTYKKDDDNLCVYFGVNGDDIPMQFIFAVDTQRQLIRLISPMPFKMNTEKRMDGAIATCVATYGMVDGNFDYDLSDGTIAFRLTKSFRESTIGEGMFQYMISVAVATVDEYNDKFLAIDKGVLSIDDFISSEAKS